MRIAIFGMGYIGCVSAACLADRGHTVIGVDVNPDKVEMVNTGISPIVEEEIPELLLRVVKAGQLRATTDAQEAINNSDLCFVCVGTPSRPNGALDLGYVTRVAEDIGRCVKNLTRNYTIVFRSTMLPGTCEGRLIPIIEKASGKRCGDQFQVCYNPEFLREGSSVRDFFDPPKTVVGTVPGHDAADVVGLYSFLEAPMFTTTIGVAEMIKYADNSFHALKVGFANEIGRFCKRMGIDSWQVMNIFNQDRKLNISTYYLWPGFAFGGSCLPKDVRALTHEARIQDVDLPILSSVLPSNEAQVRTVFKRIMELDKRRVTVVGLTFKQGTDDLRESPMVELVEMLLGKGLELKIFDNNVNIARIIGSNRKYLDEHVPHVAHLLTDSLEAALDNAEVVILGQKNTQALELLAQRDNVHVVDLVRAFGQSGKTPGNFEGISW